MIETMETSRVSGCESQTGLCFLLGLLLLDHLIKGHTISGTYYADLLRQNRGQAQEDLVLEADKKSSGQGSSPGLWISTHSTPAFTYLI